MIAITGATGQLGRLTVDALLRREPGLKFVAAVRDPAKAQDLARRGVDVRLADYDRPETLAAAFKGVDKLLLISANEPGKRFPQHRAVIDAAKQAGVKQIAYTSILHADATPLKLAEEHLATERYLAASGIPHVILRNGWYTENETAGLAGVLAHGAYIGAAKDGRFSFAARADYAEAAASVLLSDGHAGKVYELAGDTGVSMADLAAATAKAAGRPIVYQDMSEADFAKALAGFGLPGPFAGIIADSSAQAARGALFNDSRTLSRLIGRPTTPVDDTLRATISRNAA